MQPTRATILTKLHTILHPITNIQLNSQTDIEDIYYQSDKLIVHFAFPHVQSSAFRTFQRTVLKILKQDLRIHHVQLNYTHEAPNKTLEEPSPSKKLFPAAEFIVLTPNEQARATTKSAYNKAQQYTLAGNVVALIDFETTPASMLPFITQAEQNTMYDKPKLQPFMLYGEIAMMSTYLLNPHNRPMAWRDEMIDKLVRQFIYDVAWDVSTTIFLFHLPAQLNHLLPKLMTYIPELKVEVLADEES